ncbi:hypothetical protein DLAC_07977 [Tieghemostelium lacteum]|uniref:Vps72/YL1 C-terminal domain-containing protein n=1 Tax=Tieghemostelium lacteum TaxID=361077 RepID=A0A151ZB11_TIELA|nr:hypothetical protein DLAC_07977 [Tieghemostelium lacteum]|eukprot:KYQ91074.1 hypothetical protein DLAC_07977 [Tieghemostelium lacteum]
MPPGRKKKVIKLSEDEQSDSSISDVDVPLPISKRAASSKKAATPAPVNKTAARKRKKIVSSEESDIENEEIDLETSSEESDDQNESLYSDDDIQGESEQENSDSEDINIEDQSEDDSDSETDRPPNKKHKSATSTPVQPKTRGRGKKAAATPVQDQKPSLKITLNTKTGSKSPSPVSSPRSPPPPSTKKKPGRKKSVEDPIQTTQLIQPQANIIYPFKNPKFTYPVDSYKKQWKTVKQIIASENYSELPATFPTYENIEVSQTLVPTKKYCDITGLSSNYTDPKSSLRYYDSSVFKVIQKLTDDVKEAYLNLRGKGIYR